MAEALQDTLLKEYDKVLENFHNLTEIRFKLLGLLPIGTLVSTSFVGFQADKVGGQSFVFFLFGLVVTIGVAIYNTRNDQLYDELVDRAAEIERILGLPDGAFAHRPQPWRRISFFGCKTRTKTDRLAGVKIDKSGVKIDHRTGVGIIYAASMALWLFGVYLNGIELARHTIWPVIRPLLPSRHALAAPSTLDVASCIYLGALLLTLLSIFLGLESIVHEREGRKERRRELAADAVWALCSNRKSGVDSMRELSLPGTSGVATNDHLAELLKKCVELSGFDSNKIKGRAGYYGKLDNQSLRHYIPRGPEELEMAHFVALLTDLPPRWIHACATNRREFVKEPCKDADAAGIENRTAGQT